MKIADRLKYGATALTIFIAVGGIVSYRMIHLFDRNVGQIISTDEPLAESVRRMQVNIAHTAVAVSRYVQDHETKEGFRLNALKADFSQTASFFRLLADPTIDRPQALPGGMADELEQAYRPVTSLADQIVLVVDQQHAGLEALRKQVKAIDELIEEELPQPAERCAAETFAGLGSYLAERNPRLLDEIRVAQARFEVFIAQPMTGIGNEQPWSRQIKQDYGRAKQTADQLIAMSRKKHDLLEGLDAAIETVDDLLSARIRPVIRATTAAAAADVARSSRRAQVTTIVVGLSGALLVLCLYMASARRIAAGMSRLMEGTRRVGSGKLDGHIDIHTADEFGDLATALNGMMDQLASVTSSRDEIRQRERELEDLSTWLESELTQRREAEDRLRHDALHDALTGLPNRAYFSERIERCCARLKEDPTQCYAVLFLDLDNFKTINDTLGHEAGDELIVQAGERLVSCVRGNDSMARDRSNTTARLGGDEFLILLEHISEARDADRFAERVRKVFTEPFHIANRELSVTASIGIAVADREHNTAGELLRAADTAMYHAKASGKSQHMAFDATMHKEVARRLDIENGLRSALDKQQFDIHYQPIVDLHAGRICAFEALLRWNHPQHGSVSPAEFIPIAEDLGEIVPMGLFVLREACQQLWHWNRSREAGDLLSICVNVSRRQLLDPQLVERIALIMRETETPPDRLVLEITESIMMKDESVLHDSLQQLKATGVLLSMDDFGTGYSSLGQLPNMPLDHLKIDRSLLTVDGIERHHAAIVQSTIELAHNLDLTVVSEGIETRGQLAQILALGCDYGQGYAFGKPMPASGAESILDKTFDYTAADDGEQSRVA